MPTRGSRKATAKSDVAEPVYVRVRADYEARNRAFEEQAEPLRSKARDQYRALRGLLERFAADHQAVTLDRQEIELRHKLGEFDGKEFQRRLKDLDALMASKGEAHEKAQVLKQRFLDAVRSEAELETSLPEVHTSPQPFRTLEQPEAPIHTQEVVAPPAPAPPLRAPPMPPPSETQMMPALNIPLPARSVAAAAPGGGATVVVRSARLVPQTPEAGKNAVILALKPLSIGADGANDVRIGGPGVEPRHAQVTVSMAGYTVVDMNTSHGTRVNAEKIRERLLRDQDVIQVGAARWVFREG